MNPDTKAKPGGKAPVATAKRPPTVGTAQFLGLLPGVVVAALLAWLSLWLSEFIGVDVLRFENSPLSAVMIALIMGMVLGNTVRIPTWIDRGLAFCVRRVLRLGIVLLGVRLSILDVFRLGALGIPIVLLCILAALLLTTRLSSMLHLSRRLGTLIAVGTSICGVSAIIACGATIEAEDEEVAYAVAVITVFGMVATLVYPYLAHALFPGDAIRAGLFLGTAIHDTSQVTGAALVMSDVFTIPRVVDVATVTKLIRNVFMVLVIPLMSFYFARGSEGQRSMKGMKIARLLPMFVIGFLATAAVRSIGDATLADGKAFGIWGAMQWEAAIQAIGTWAANLLVVALVAVGLTTKFRSMQRIGLAPFLAGLGAALSVGAVSAAAVSLLGGLIVP